MRKDLLAYMALAAVCLIWGTTYLALRIAVTHFPPFLFSGIRQTTAGLILLAFMLTLGKQKLPSTSILWQQAIAGFLMMTVGNGLVAWAEMHIPSGIAAILCSLMPIWVILINVSIDKGEKPTLPIMAGTVLGLLGIVLIFGNDLSELTNSNYLMGIGMTLLATAGWASGSVWIKKQHINTNPFVNAGLQMFFGGLFMLILSPLTDDLSNVHWSQEAFYAMLYLIVFGSLIAYTCYAYAIRKLPMTIVSMYAYINPLVAVLLGWLILDEVLNLRIGIAMLITITGIYLVNRGYQLKKFMEGSVLEIIDYQPEHQPWFEQLNRSWIERYFWMEPIDFEVLQKPDIHILRNKGSILMARYQNAIVGTVALKFVEEGLYEFTKMAVDEKYQGLKIGRALAEAAIKKAQHAHAHAIILYSNTALKNAIELYRKLGFVEVPLDGPYKRSDIKMKLIIKE